MGSADHPGGRSPRRGESQVRDLGIAAIVLGVLAFGLWAAVRPVGAGADGPVVTIAPSRFSELASSDGITLRLEDGCLYAGDQAVVWPAGTRWQEEPAAVVLPHGAVLRVGQRTEISLSGGTHPAGALGEFGIEGELQDRVAGCAGGDEGQVLVVQSG